MRASIIGGLLATALMAVGCGAPMEEEEGVQLSTQEAAIPDCSGSADSLRTYYSDASYTTKIGARGCSCGLWVSWGRTSSYHQFISDCM
ncbi:hypothetical protein F0U61_08700 [Archangium violaceum]|uniref:hypothetical protein n=1 Tax=Archangium violaceum TaxID=83451 RepID=UPI002B2B8E4B|nr:hypothetical protein F0U61_08700 [Archangium violaceum]